MSESDAELPRHSGRFCGGGFEEGLSDGVAY